MKNLRVLHIASFTGNIGDNANHMGFRPWFEGIVNASVEWTSLEIREFYWKERLWDLNLVEFINTFDLLIIGGGNYFELWVEDSPTGTSIAIEQDMFKKIKVPVYFNALGVDPGQGVPKTSLNNFRSFMSIIDTPQYLVTVRNDGALKNLEQYVGDSYANMVHRTPDGGFFVGDYHEFNQKITNDTRIIAINLASDMPEVRFKNFPGREIEFSAEIAKTVNELAIKIPGSTFILIPHIFRDLEIITKVIEQLSDRLRRTRVNVAQYGHGDDATLKILEIYNTADLVLGMRFHSNVCAMSLKKAVLGLCSYPQIFNLYSEVGLEKLAVDISLPNFSSSLVNCSIDLLTNDLGHENDIAHTRATHERNEFEPTLKAWLDENSL